MDKRTKLVVEQLSNCHNEVKKEKEKKKTNKIMKISFFILLGFHRYQKALSTLWEKK